MPQVLVFVLFFAGVYFLLLRPQQQRVRRQRELITAIGVGDRVVTAGGLIGRVVDLDDERLYLEVADGVTVELLRMAVSRRLDPAESDAELDASADEEVDEDRGGYGDEAELTEGDGRAEADPGEADAGHAAEPAAPGAPAAAADSVDPGGSAAHPTQGAAHTDATIEEAGAPAPRQEPN